MTLAGSPKSFLYIMFILQEYIKWAVIYIYIYFSCAVRPRASQTSQLINGKRHMGHEEDQIRPFSVKPQI
jgi:hypothetical protein